MSVDELRELLEGYVDPQVKAAAINAVGKTGLNSRLYCVFYFQAFVMSLYRARHHRIVRYFQDIYFLTYDTAMTSWFVETLRLMDWARSRAEGVDRENMTVPLFHERFHASSLVPAADKRTEQERYEELNRHCEANGFRKFRNHRMFHLDLHENMKKPTPSGNLGDVTDLLRAWYEHAAGVVVGGEPRFITETSVSRGIEQAATLKHLMVDALRYQRLKGGPYTARDYTRYGWSSGTWIDDLNASHQNGEPDA